MPAADGWRPPWRRRWTTGWTCRAGGARRLRLAPVVLAAALLAGETPAAACEAEADRVWAEAAATLLEAADEAAAEARLRAALAAHPACERLAVAFWAVHGLLHARHAATHGGSPEALEPVAAALVALERWRTHARLSPAVRYAEAALRAAMAAAQDERDEMGVWLAHATDLAARLALAGEQVRWPLPAPLLAADLWYEVDRLEEARDRYRGVLAADPSAYAWRGLARTLVRLRDIEGACEAYRALAARLAGRGEAPGAEEARAFVARPACGGPSR